MQNLLDEEEALQYSTPAKEKSSYKLAKQDLEVTLLSSYDDAVKVAHSMVAAYFRRYVVNLL